MNICIIGAGWFGCHIAINLIKEGHNVKIFEKNSNIFSNASGKNQNRLHQGFHYPRSKKTIEFSKRGFLKFKKEYGFLTKTIRNNVYSISKSEKSKMNFEKYCLKMKQSKLRFKILNLNSSILKKLSNLEGSILCNEELILVSKSINYFKKKLKSKIKFNFNINNISRHKDKFIINNQEFDYVINCTGFRLKHNVVKKLIYEYCVIFLYKKKNYSNNFALTVMDGPFFTLYPWSDKNEYGLYSVNNSRLIKNQNFKNLEKKVNKIINKKFLNETRLKVEKKFESYYPTFRKDFKFRKYLTSYRTLIEDKFDTRVCTVKSQNKIISVFPGKIDHIFYAYEKVKKCLKKY